MGDAIQVDNLVMRYRRAKEAAVDDISFHVREGEFFALLGPNGAGKTTTISVLTTALAKTGGTVSIAGHNLDREAKKIRADIAVVFQNPSLDLELTAEENIRLHAGIYGSFGYRPFYTMMPRAYKRRIEELAAIVGLQESLFKKLGTFSGGMKRKLEIIRSLMHNPKIIFLDEPTKGLDVASRHSLWEYLNKVRVEENVTIFLTTHYLEEAEDADRLCIVNGGKIVMTGTPGQLKDRLVERHMYVDAIDRDSLKAELSLLGEAFVETGQGLKVAYKGSTPQQILSRLTASLTKLDLCQPTLEEAYLKLINGRGEL